MKILTLLAIGIAFFIANRQLKYYNLRKEMLQAFHEEALRSTAFGS